MHGCAGHGWGASGRTVTATCAGRELDARVVRAFSAPACEDASPGCAAATPPEPCSPRCPACVAPSAAWARTPPSPHALHGCRARREQPPHRHRARSSCMSPTCAAANIHTPTCAGLPQGNAQGGAVGIRGRAKRCCPELVVLQRAPAWLCCSVHEPRRCGRRGGGAGGARGRQPQGGDKEEGEKTVAREEARAEKE
jgi:hypothetical protein